MVQNYKVEEIFKALMKITLDGLKKILGEEVTPEQAFLYLT